MDGKQKMLGTETENMEKYGIRQMKIALFLFFVSHNVPEFDYGIRKENPLLISHYDTFFIEKKKKERRSPMGDPA